MTALVAVAAYAFLTHAEKRPAPRPTKPVRRPWSSADESRHGGYSRGCSDVFGSWYVCPIPAERA